MAQAPRPERPNAAPAGLDLRFAPDESELPLGEAAYRALRRALRSGQLKPGDRLREEEVSQALGVSRTPVREALGRLLARRLIEPAGARGMVVRRLATPEVLELYALREILEGAAARLAARHASPAEIAMMDAAESRFETAASDEQELGRLNRGLHQTIFQAARNRYLDAALLDMQDSLALLGPTTFGVAGRRDTAAGEHRAILEAIRRRDGDGAEAAAREHMRASLQARIGMLTGT